MHSHEVPPCLSDIVEQADTHNHRITSVVRPCWEGCPYREEARMLGDITPDAIEKLRRDYKKGKFLNCLNR